MLNRGELLLEFSFSFSTWLIFGSDLDGLINHWNDDYADLISALNALHCCFLHYNIFYIGNSCFVDTRRKT